MGTDRLLYGSDIPFAPGGFIDRNTAAVSSDLVARTRDNTARLFASAAPTVR
ncbi:hypothetical protein [Mycobacterium sp. C31M]